MGTWFFLLLNPPALKNNFNAPPPPPKKICIRKCMCPRQCLPSIQSAVKKVLQKKNGILTFFCHIKLFLGIEFKKNIRVGHICLPPTIQTKVLYCVYLPYAVFTLHSAVRKSLVEKSRNLYHVYLLDRVILRCTFQRSINAEVTFSNLINGYAVVIIINVMIPLHWRD